MNELLDRGISLKYALLICKTIRDCMHQTVTVDGIAKDQDICCNCGLIDKTLRGQKYSCHICKQLYCGNCCESMYYGGWDAKFCHNTYTFEPCKTCGILVRKTTFTLTTNNKTSKCITNTE